MKNILAILTMVSFSALAAEESDTQKLDNVLDKSKETGKNVMVILSVENNKLTPPKREELQKAFRLGPNSDEGKAILKRIRMRPLNMSFMNTKEFKDYQKEYLLVIKFNINDVKDLPEKVRNDFEVKSIPSVILVRNGKVVHRYPNKALPRGRQQLPRGFQRLLQEYKWFDKRYGEVLKDSRDKK